MSLAQSALAQSALAEVWSWTLADVLSALRDPAEHTLSAAEVERMAAMRGIGFAAGLLVERAYEHKGWQVASRALIASARAALTGVEEGEAPPMALAFLDSARSHLGRDAVKWEAIELYARAAHDDRSPPLIAAAARVALSATHLAGEPAPGDVAREALEQLFVALPAEERLSLVCRALSVLEERLADRVIAPSLLEELALRGGAITAEARFYGVPSSLARVRAWGPSRVLRALHHELDAGVRWSAADFARWAKLEGADFAAGRVLAAVDREHGAGEAAGLLGEAQAFVFRELGLSIREEAEEAPTVASLGAEYAGRVFLRALARVEGGPALTLRVLAFLEARAAALSGNGGAGAPLSL